MSDKTDNLMLGVRVTKELVRKMDARAKYLTGKLGVSVTRSDVARKLIEAGLKDEKKKNGR